MNTTKTILAALSLLIAWRFWSFYLVKDKDKGKRSFYLTLGFIVFIAAVIGFARVKYPREFRTALTLPAVRFLSERTISGVNKFLVKHFWYLIIPGVLALGAEIGWKHWLSKKEARHGPDFRPPKKSKGGFLAWCLSLLLRKKDKNGIVVGKFDRKVLPKQIRSFAPATSADIAIPFDRLSRGVTILGDMGSGKSRLMVALVDGIRERYPDIPVLIHDPKGEWLRAFYDVEEDMIFAPHDKRSSAWALWRDFEKHPELRHPIISTAVLQHHSGPNSDIFWTGSGTLLLKDIAQASDLVEAKKKLIILKKRNEDDGTWRSIYTSAKIGLRDIAAIELMNCESSGYGIDDLLNHPGRIFLLNNPSIADEQHGSLTLLLSAFMIRALAGPDVAEGELRAAVIMDEAVTFNLPADVERAVFTQSRSKGLAIIAGAVRLPKENQGERGAWADHPAHIFGMKVTDMMTRQILAKRVGSITYDEKQKSVSSGKTTSTTESETQRRHDAIAPEDWALDNREFVLFHENGLAPGRVKDVEFKQRDTIDVIVYDPRKDVADFMTDL
ncbi:MAG: hypothetical protein CVT48_01075 [Thermoplasmata archaeon HGW-Thermoplasmata-1]|nr:MAG: hypothetical protein CVT48_01075 [Thermoplasmata archaeon HGW-Thermoplasmata-1]